MFSFSILLNKNVIYNNLIHVQYLFIFILLKINLIIRVPSLVQLILAKLSNCGRRSCKKKRSGRFYYLTTRSYVISFPRNSLCTQHPPRSIVDLGCSQSCFDGGGTRAGREEKTKHRLTGGGLVILSLLLENAGSSRDVLRAKKRLMGDEGMKETPKQRGMKREREREQMEKGRARERR